MQASVKKSVTTGVLTAVLAAALSIPALGVAAPAPAVPVTVHASDAVAVSAAAAQGRATVAAQAAAQAEIAAARAAAIKSAQAQTAQAAAYTAARKSKTNSTSRPKGSELSRARAILASLKARYPRYLGGVTVTIGSARGYQAISYYTVGRIVVSPTHRASLERILGHEIWHIIDWRDNGRIDWRESIPPANAGSYR